MKRTRLFSETDVRLALKHIRQDVSDDFWPDIINYADMTSDMPWSTSVNFDAYQPHDIKYVDVPKLTLVLRPGHYIDFKDRVYYQLLVNTFAHDVDKQFVADDVNYGYRISNKLASKFFREGIQAWQRFRDKDADLFEASDGEGLLLETDISAYFEHIKIGRLLETLLNLGVDGDITRKLGKLLMYWSESGIGIPQGNATSSFLANVYLDEVDKAMVREGYTYYRYMDDIRIFADDEITIRRAVQRLTQLFRPLNLHLNSGKTKLVDFTFHRAELNKHKDLMEAVNYVLAFEEYPETQVVDESLQEIWHETVTQRHIDKTKFRYCVIRFKKIKSDFPLNDLIEHKLYDPANIDIVSRYLEDYVDREDVQGLILDKIMSSAYEYEMIYLLKLLSRAESISFDFSKLDKSKMYGTQNSLLIGYYFLLAAKFGTQGDRGLITADYNKLFKSNHDMNRYFMIASCYFPNAQAEVEKMLSKYSELKATADYLAGKSYIV